jgi:hypothetical protein
MSRQDSEKICEAIRSCHRLSFDYAGQHRVVEPYCHGTAANGGELLRAIQVGGSSSSGGFGFGKLWKLADIERLRVLPEVFVPDDPHYNPEDSALARIHCCVAPARQT